MEHEREQVQWMISDLLQLSEVTDTLQRQLQRWDVSPEKQMDIRLCLMEAVQNAFLYGCAELDSLPKVTISWNCTEEGFEFSVEDPGPGIPDFIRNGNWENCGLEEHGRGILLMQTILDEVVFNENGNRITGRIRW